MFILVLLAALQAVPAPSPETALYVVGPSDVLAITVFNQPQLTGKFAIEADGTLAFPLVGRIKVGGLNIRAVEDDLRKRLANGYLTDPQVNVTVEQYRSQQIFVMGEVKQPGTLQFTGAMTLIEALARVGSPTDRAGSEVVVVRPPGPPEATSKLPSNSPNSETIRVGSAGPSNRGAVAEHRAPRGRYDFRAAVPDASCRGRSRRPASTLSEVA